MIYIRQLIIETAEEIGVPELEELTLKEHEGIFECISKGDAMGAAKSISDHILRVNKLYSQNRN